MKSKVLFAMIMAISFALVSNVAYAKGVEKGSHSFHSVNEMIGWEVRNTSGDKLGKVEDYMHDEHGRLIFAIVSEGGVAGVGGKKVAVPYSSLSLGKDRDKDRYDHFVMKTTRDKLASAPEFKGEETLSRSFAEKVYRHFGVQPYWMEKGMEPKGRY